MPATSEIPAPDGSRPDLPSSLFERSDRAGLARLVLHLAILGLTAALVSSAEQVWLLVLAMTVHGVALVFLFSALHECIHRTAFASRWLNDAVAAGSGFLLLLPKEYFRCFHLAHHRHTQDPTRDPELMAKKPRTRAGYLLHLSGLPYWRERVCTLLRHASGKVGEGFIEPGRRAAVIREARLHIALYALVAGTALAMQSALVLFLWIIPVVLGQPFLRGFLLAEHAGCPLIGDMLRNSRTTLTNPPVSLLTWNMPYHAEHHAFAALPFHALPQAHALLQPRIEHQSGGYLRVHQGIWHALSSAGSKLKTC